MKIIWTLTTFYDICPFNLICWIVSNTLLLQTWRNFGFWKTHYFLGFEPEKNLRVLVKKPRWISGLNLVFFSVWNHILSNKGCSQNSEKGFNQKGSCRSWKWTLSFDIDFRKPRYYREPVPQCKKADLKHAITFNWAWVLQGLLLLVLRLRAEKQK